MTPEHLTDERLADLHGMCDKCLRGLFLYAPSQAEFEDLAAALTRLRVLERAILHYEKQAVDVPCFFTAIRTAEQEIREEVQP